MRALAPWVTVLLLVAGLAAAAKLTPEQLKARADAASGAEKAKWCLEYARVTLEGSDALFSDGQADKALSQIQEVVEYARRGADASPGKQVKDTEIKLRKLADRMRDIAESLAFEDRPPVRQALEQIQQIRSNLMVRMWGPQAEPKGKS